MFRSVVYLDKMTFKTLHLWLDSHSELLSLCVSVLAPPTSSLQRMHTSLHIVRQIIGQNE